MMYNKAIKPTSSKFVNNTRLKTLAEIRLWVKREESIVFVETQEFRMPSQRNSW